MIKRKSHAIEDEQRLHWRATPVRLARQTDQPARQTSFTARWLGDKQEIVVEYL